MAAMETISTINFIGTALFAIAILHTFSTKYFEHLAHTHKKFSGILHLLGEVEIVFGFWAMVLVVFMFILEGSSSAVGYVDSRNFTEPMFVFVIMVIAATKPILEFSEKIVILISKFIPIKTEVGMFFLLLSFVPLLGSFKILLSLIPVREVIHSSEVSISFSSSLLVKTNSGT